MSRNTNPTPATVATIRERDDHRCVRCGGTDQLTTHHRRPRGMGGTRWEGINRPANLLTVCGSGTTGCHGHIEGNRAEALAAGLLVSKYADPSHADVWTWRGWLRLSDTGEAVRVDLSPPF